ncbi:Alpha/Beta hydrolase protein [Fomitopsis serialis]|uniref:Alpha/Beta hydrolase protein n=1 Tax=Fomitopsis serialis TaxID=139415 RepID=UPI0020084765|nr:Alpha/Beta hydrolase protein [Neoantrodia serialis]KAH9916866.1 Alpha/Beta hydrolase protein [Neoantrodia serialis]
MQTVTYSRVGSLEIQLDIRLPPSPTAGALPAVVHFHGGGMTTGARSGYDCWQWLIDSTLDKGMMFMSADYRLIHPSTGFDIIEDVKALMKFLADPSFSENHLPAGLSLDASRIGVAGVSGGGYAARAAAIYGEPKPRAVYLLYCMGGDLLCDHWVADKGDSIFNNAPPIPRTAVAHLLDAPISPTAGSALTPGPGKWHDEQGRMSLFPYWGHTGELLDYVLGEPISATLRALPAAKRAAAVPERLRPALLETQIDVSFPPTFLLHGDADVTVPLSESQKTVDRLRELGVKTELEIVPGGGHALMMQVAVPPEFCPGAAEAHEKGMQFLARELLDSVTTR